MVVHNYKGEIFHIQCQGRFPHESTFEQSLDANSISIH